MSSSHWLQSEGGGTCNGRSAVFIRKRSGPNTHPWGTQASWRNLPCWCIRINFDVLEAAIKICSKPVKQRVSESEVSQQWDCRPSSYTRSNALLRWKTICNEVLVVQGYGQPVDNPCELENSGVRLPKSLLANGKNWIFVLLRWPLSSSREGTDTIGVNLMEMYSWQQCKKERANKGR